MKKIFIGSSREAIPVAEAVFFLLGRKHAPKLWTHHIFGLSDYAVDSLKDEAGSSDFAVLIAAPDDRLISRGIDYDAMRDNILFELGLFMGALGRKKTFLIIPADSKLKIPSDLYGLTCATYRSNEVSDNLSDNISCLQQACLEIEHAIQKEQGTIAPVKKDDYESNLNANISTLFSEAVGFRDYDMVMELGGTVCQFLRKRGFYSTLEKIGMQIEETASRKNKLDMQAEALIEYLGWMKVSWGKIKEGESYIRLGIDVAKRCRNIEWECKGARYLAGIFMIEKDYDKAIEILQEVKELAESISDEVLRYNQLAPTYYGIAQIELIKENLEEAGKMNATAAAYYEKARNISSSVKLRAQLGKILELQQELLLAKHEYNKGLELAEYYRRNDEQIRNLLGLHSVHTKLGNKSDAEKYLTQANDLMKITKLSF